MRRSLRNAWGRLKGFGECNNCGNTWDWAKDHTFQYTNHSGAFPICEDCWNKASDKDIIKATEKMIDTWVEQNTGYYNKKKAMENGQLVLNKVYKDLKKRKVKRLFKLPKIKITWKQ